MTKKIDTSFFASNARLQGTDLRNVEFKKENDPEDGGMYTTVVNKGDGTVNHTVQSDAAGNKFYVPEQLNGIGDFEAKVRVYNNDIDNYTSAENANVKVPHYRRFGRLHNDERGHVTDAMIYEDRKIGASKRQETMNNMDVKPSDYSFVATVSQGNKNGFIGNDNRFVENWGAPVDTSQVKYYEQMDECVTDALVFNHQNSSSGASGGYNPTLLSSGELFIAIPKKDIPSK